MLNNDNADSRKMIEQCYKLSKTVVNPIIDWTDDDVWEFIHEYSIQYCELYDKGYKRLGCIGCPMGSVEHRREEFERYPKYKQAYIKAFDKMVDARNRGGVQTDSGQWVGCLEMVCRWRNAKEVMEWWIR